MLHVILVQNSTMEIMARSDPEHAEQIKIKLNLSPTEKSAFWRSGSKESAEELPL